MLSTNFSSRLRVFWSFLLSFMLSGAALADAYVLSTPERESTELGLTDEESKAESEKVEENNGRKSAENIFEGSNGADGPFEKDALETSFLQKNILLSPLSCCYAYYPHINYSENPYFEASEHTCSQLFILYHSLVFYEHIS